MSREMPSHQVHCFLDRMIFGKSYWKLHKLIDKPYFFSGHGHRKYFHDISALAIARRYFPQDKDAEWSAWAHVQLDLMCSENPGLKKMLTLMAARYYRIWWRSKQKNKELRVKFSLDFLVFLNWFRSSIGSRNYS